MKFSEMTINGDAMYMEEPEYRTLKVHYVEKYYSINDDETEPLRVNDGDAELEFYAFSSPTDGDVEEALQIGGYLVARHGTEFYRESLELDYR